jgi:hypothetical protein
MPKFVPAGKKYATELARVDDVAVVLGSASHGRIQFRSEERREGAQGRVLYFRRARLDYC